VLVTCGADDALERTVRVVVGPDRKAVLTTPTYGMIRRFVLTAGGQPDEVEWWGGDFPVEEVCRRAHNAGLVAVVSPSNPTGAVVSKAAFSELVRRLPATLVLLDQAYVDFCDPEFDLTEIALASPNVVIVRTMSKAAGCAGLRVGCAIGDPRVIDWMRRLGLPFPVPTPALEMASKVLAAGPDGARIERVRSQRAAVTELLEGLGAEVLPSEASFVFARFADAVRVWAALGALDISVRRFPGRAGVGEWLRVTLPGDHEAWGRLERAFRSILAPEALLFDMDGVLADVSRSYRRAIIETAASWDVTVSSADVETANAAGNSNNDWELTRRLLAERGVEASLDEVTARFEELYQGTDDQPGLRSEETLLLPRDVLARLSENRALAVVTGRPRADAERFLAEHGLEGVFKTVVCMEDGPLKPDPAPVRTALDRLGVDSAWMVGDTPDDLRAAAAAGVLPVGVVAPGDEPDGARSVLAGAGAAFVLESITELEGVLP
jgi:HAD superfamily hydrolase (TIGR01548 family)